MVIKFSKKLYNQKFTKNTILIFEIQYKKDERGASAPLSGMFSQQTFGHRP